MLTISATRLTPCTKKPAKPLVFASTGRGFTLLEALLALGLMALVAGVALPRWLGQQARQHLQLAGASLQRAAWLAQLHAHPTGSQRSDRCATLTLGYDGQRQATGGTHCW